MMQPKKKRRNRSQRNSADEWRAPDLRGQVAVVCGASRGAGRGIALALGPTGATVYVTGRSVRAGPAPYDNAPGTVEGTAEEVTRRGGKGITARVDHTSEEDVAALFQRVEREHGRLDVLVNSVWGSNQWLFDIFLEKHKRPYWEARAADWWEVMQAGPYAHLLTNIYAARTMTRQRRGLIISITEPVHEDWQGGSAFFWAWLGLGHRGINRIIETTAGTLKKHKVTCVGVLPGFMRTERVMMVLGDDEKLKKKYEFHRSESTEYAGRAVASLAADKKVLRHAGKLLYLGDLARQYRFRDVDGRQPHFYHEVGKLK